MNLNSLFYVCLVLLLELKGLHGIKANLQAIPSIVRRGSHTVLRCIYYDLRGAPLYAVKWYRGMREFYRFDPSDTPQKRVFEIMGIYVDLAYSNSTQVTLRKLDFSSSGNYTCEVSADGPPFPTATDTTHVEVVAPPSEGPVITTNANSYFPGDDIQVNCTGPPSRPALNLTLIINNQHMSGAKKFYYDTDVGFKKSVLIVMETLNNFHFKGGKMVIKCVGQLRPLYVETAIKTFWYTSDPKPERITSFGDSGTAIVPNFYFIFLILSLLFIKTVLLEDYNDFYTLLDEPNFQDALYYEDVPQDVKRTLLTS